MDLETLLHGDPQEAASMISRAKEWLSSINYTLRLDFKESDPKKGLVEYAIPGLPNKSSFNHKSKNTYFSISFTKKIRQSSSLQDLKQSLDYVSLDQLPTPGFDYPEHWSVYPRTSVSSFTEGVTIHSFENNRIQYSIDTSFFLLYGNIPSKQWSCGPSPPHTYFGVNIDKGKKFRGLINVDMAMSYV